MNDIQPYQLKPEGTLQKEDDSKWLGNYNSLQSRERRCDVSAFQFSPSRLRMWLPVQP